MAYRAIKQIQPYCTIDYKVQSVQNTEEVPLFINVVQGVSSINIPLLSLIFLPYFYPQQLRYMHSTDELIELISRWAEFKKVYPEGSSENFHRFELAKRDTGSLASEHIRGNDPQSTANRLMKVIARLHLSYNVYLRIALKDTPLEATEKFAFLAALNVIGESSKTHVINYAMMEMSTGIDILNRLLKDNFISQRIDPADKRAKLIRITDAGFAVLQQCFSKTAMIREILLHDLTEDEEKICVQILYPVQEKHAKLAVENKHRTIEEILEAQHVAP